MDPVSYTNSKRPPKLRSACNGCHAAKVRCSGEKTGCQRCSNLRLKCAFSISRIGKVPGKRSKANRVAAAVTSSAILTSSSSQSTPIMSPPPATVARPFEAPLPIAFDRRTAMSIPTTSYPFAHEYPTAYPLESEATYAHSLDYPTQSNPENLSSLHNLCWTAELDQLGAPGLLSPDWGLDNDAPIQHLAPAVSTYPDAHPGTKEHSKQYPSPTESLPSTQYMVYLHLLHSIDQTIHHQSNSSGDGNTFLSTVASTLITSQRYTTTLLDLTSGPTFAHTYTEEHLLLSVVLDKLIFLFRLAHSDLKRWVEIYNIDMGMTCPGAGPGLGPGTANPWTRLGILEMDIAEPMAFCRRTLTEELKRTRVCLGRLMDAMGLDLGWSTTVSISSSYGKHEAMCEGVRGRLDTLMDDLENDEGINGLHLVC